MLIKIQKITYKDCLYFSDSGPFGETSIENQKVPKFGSIFMIDLEAQIIRPLALNCLAYPSGLALTNDEKILYACETGKNRVLRFILSQQGIYFFSVFAQFTGKYGPTAVTISASGLIYVARYEFSQFEQEGLISILNSSGQIVENINVPGAPEITGLTFSKLKANILYATENSTTPCLIRIIAQQEEKEDKKEKNTL